MKIFCAKFRIGKQIDVFHPLGIFSEFSHGRVYLLQHPNLNFFPVRFESWWGKKKKSDSTSLTKINDSQ